jgi:hypothetical protein
MIFVNVVKIVIPIFLAIFGSFAACFPVHLPVDVLAYAVIYPHDWRVDGGEKSHFPDSRSKQVNHNALDDNVIGPHGGAVAIGGAEHRTAVGD